MKKLLFFVCFLMFTSVGYSQTVFVLGGYNQSTTSVQLISGNGSNIKSVPVFMWWWDYSAYLSNYSADPLLENVLVTNRVGDTLTVVRAQNGTTANNHNISGHFYAMGPSVYSTITPNGTQTPTMTPAVPVVNVGNLPTVQIIQPYGTQTPTGGISYPNISATKVAAGATPFVVSIPSEYCSMYVSVQAGSVTQGVYFSDPNKSYLNLPIYSAYDFFSGNSLSNSTSIVTSNNSGIVPVGGFPSIYFVTNTNSPVTISYVFLKPCVGNVEGSVAREADDFFNSNLPSPPLVDATGSTVILGDTAAVSEVNRETPQPIQQSSISTQIIIAPNSSVTLDLSQGAYSSMSVAAYFSNPNDYISFGDFSSYSFSGTAAKNIYFLNSLDYSVIRHSVVDQSYLYGSTYGPNLNFGIADISGISKLIIFGNTLDSCRVVINFSSSQNNVNFSHIVNWPTPIITPTPNASANNYPRVSEIALETVVAAQLTAITGQGTPIAPVAQATIVAAQATLAAAIATTGPGSSSMPSAVQTAIAAQATVIAAVATTGSSMPSGVQTAICAQATALANAQVAATVTPIFVQFPYAVQTAISIQQNNISSQLTAVVAELTVVAGQNPLTPNATVVAGKDYQITNAALLALIEAASNTTVTNTASISAMATAVAAQLTVVAGQNPPTPNATVLAGKDLQITGTNLLALIDAALNTNVANTGNLSAIATVVSAQLTVVAGQNPPTPNATVLAGKDYQITTQALMALMDAATNTVVANTIVLNSMATVVAAQLTVVAGQTPGGSTAFPTATPTPVVVAITDSVFANATAVVQATAVAGTNRAFQARVDNIGNAYANFVVLFGSKGVTTAIPVSDNRIICIPDFVGAAAVSFMVTGVNGAASTGATFSISNAWYDYSIWPYPWTGTQK
jgi:hypothetical protein